jgi:hypothetical protein
MAIFFSELAAEPRRCEVTRTLWRPSFAFARGRFFIAAPTATRFFTNGRATALATKDQHCVRSRRFPTLFEAVASLKGRPKHVQRIDEVNFRRHPTAFKVFADKMADFICELRVDWKPVLQYDERLD